MSKEKLSASEWEMVKYAPNWVNQALAEADGRVAFFTKRRENKAFEKAIKEYKSGNALVNDIIHDDSDAPKAIEKASQADAEKALSEIATIVEKKLGSDDLAALKDFLLKVGHAVANSSKEGGVGNAKAVTEKEAAALLRIESALKVSASYATAHATAPAAKPSSSAKPAAAAAAASASVKRDDETSKKAEQEKKLAEARERQEKAREQAEAEKKEAAAKERLEAARKETEERRQAAAAEREAKEKAEAEAARKEAEAKAAAAAPKYTQFIAEHTVQPGDNLSFISQKYYGHQGNFRIIYEANREVIGDNMNLIRPGQVLKIPKL